MSFEFRQRPAPVRADVHNPNFSYVPSGHKRPADKLVNGVSPGLTPLKGLGTEDFDNVMSTVAEADNEILHGYDPKRFLRIREYFLKLSLKDEDEMDRERQSAELLTAQIWNEAASLTLGSSPYVPGSKEDAGGPVHDSEWYKRKNQGIKDPRRRTDLKVMNKTSRAHREVTGWPGEKGIMQTYKQSKVVGNAEVQPAARAVKRDTMNNDTSHNARKNKDFLHDTTHHLKHTHHEIIDRVVGTEKASALRPIKRIKAAMRNRGKIAPYMKAAAKNNVKKQKITAIQNARQTR